MDQFARIVQYQAGNNGRLYRQKWYITPGTEWESVDKTVRQIQGDCCDVKEHAEQINALCTLVGQYLDNLRHFHQNRTENYAIAQSFAQQYFEAIHCENIKELIR